MRVRQFRLPLVVTLAMLLAGCGYFRSGTWENDPGNFARAWGISKPADVDVVHSWYWRGAHFTREEEYFFHFRWHESVFRGFIENNKLEPVTDDRLRPEYCSKKPDWFAPGNWTQYEVWHRPESQGWLLRQRATRDLFIYVCQI